MYDNYHKSYGDSVLYDTKLACILLCCGIIFLSILAWLGYTSSPGNFITNSWNVDWSQFFYNLFRPMGIFFILVFICSIPSKIEILIVLLSWGICIFIGLFLGWENFYPALHHASFYKTTLAIPCTFIVLIKTIKSLVLHKTTLYDSRLRWLIFQLILFMHILDSALPLTIFFHPYILDLYALHFDMLLLPQLTPLIVHFFHAFPKGGLIMQWSYNPISIFPLILAIRQLNGRHNYIPSVTLVWSIVGILGLMSYMVYPITGPVFAFGSDFYNKFNQLMHMDLAPIIQLTDLRNGMPSLHFSWTLLSTIFWWQTTKNILWRSITLVYCIFLAMSTLYLGQHYLVDLIVAVPFSLGCLALANTNIPLTHYTRRNTIIAGFFGWLVWIISLYHPQLFITYSFAINILVLFTATMVVYQCYCISCFKDAGQSSLTPKITLDNHS